MRHLPFDWSSFWIADVNVFYHQIEEKGYRTDVLQRNKTKQQQKTQSLHCFIHLNTYFSYMNPKSDKITLI